MNADRIELIIVGAGGHGRVVADAAIAAGFTVSGFIDRERMPGTLVNSVPVIGNDELIEDEQFVAAYRFVVALGDQKVRRSISERLDKCGALAVIIHPSCVVSRSVSIGAGTILAAGVVVNANASIGRYCILNTACSVDHDCVLEDGVQLCPGVRLAGNVICRAESFVGTGAATIPGVTIGETAIVGAGAVVVSDVERGTVVFGNPARVRTRNQ